MSSFPVSILSLQEYSEHQRMLKGNDDGGDDDGTGIPGLPDLGDIGDIVDTCFSEVATVQTLDKGVVAMKDLAVGDAVLTHNGAYEPIYAFGHYNPTKEAEFLQLTTANSVLEMTGEHLVFLQNKENPVRADSVQVGDVLRSADSSNTLKVNKVNTIQRQGLYAPLTNSGTVVVDGVVASSYISLQKESNEFVQIQDMSTGISQQQYVHLVLSPFRLLCQGVSNNFCTAYDQEGMPYYITYGIAANNWASNSGILVQSLALALFCLLAGFFMILENTFGASLAPLVLALVGGAYAFSKATGVTVRANKSKTV